MVVSVDRLSRIREEDGCGRNVDVEMETRMSIYKERIWNE